MKTFNVLLLGVAFLLTSPPVLARGDLKLDLDEERCVLNLGPTSLRVNISRTLPVKGILCENLPRTGIYRTSFILNGKTKNLEIDFRVLRDVGQSDDNDNLDQNTEYYLPAEKYKGGVATFEHDYKERGDFIGIVRARGYQGKNFVEYIARFPFSVGNENASEEVAATAEGNEPTPQSSLPPCPTRRNPTRTNCFGKVKTPESTYEGEFQNDQPDGTGTLILKKGGKYVGQFKQGKVEGQGTFTFPDGEIYTGEFKNNDKDGQGKLVLADGSTYEGQFKAGDYDGEGTFTKRNGTKYVGTFRDNEKNGHGTETTPQNEVYVGEFKDDRYEGQGVLTFPDGSRYEGSFKGGRYHGHGTITVKDTKLEGEFVDGEVKGNATEIFGDGTKYVGEFKGVGREGNGTLYAADGSVARQGVWKNDQFVQGEDGGSDNSLSTKAVENSLGGTPADKSNASALASIPQWVLIALIIVSVLALSLIGYFLRRRSAPTLIIPSSSEKTLSRDFHTLEELHKLKEAGVITEEDFSAQKKAILEKIERHSN